MTKIKQTIHILGLVAAVVCLAFCLSACGPKTIEVKIDDPAGASTVTVDEGTTVEDILSKAGIELAANDKVSPALDAKPANGDTITITRMMSITVVDGEDIYAVLLPDGTVADAVEAAGLTLEEGDTTDPALDTVLTNDMSILVTRAPESEPQLAPENEWGTVYDSLVSNQAANAGAPAPDASGVYEVSRVPVPNCADGSHGYYEITMSDGSMRYEEY